MALRIMSKCHKWQGVWKPEEFSKASMAAILAAEADKVKVIPPEWKRRWKMHLKGSKSCPYVKGNRSGDISGRELSKARFLKVDEDMRCRTCMSGVNPNPTK